MPLSISGTIWKKINLVSRLDKDIGRQPLSVLVPGRLLSSQFSSRLEEFQSTFLQLREEMQDSKVTQVAVQVDGVVTQVGGVATQVGGVATQVGGVATQVGGVATQVGELAVQVGGLTDIQSTRLVHFLSHKESDPLFPTSLRGG